MVSNYISGTSEKGRTGTTSVMSSHLFTAQRISPVCFIWRFHKLIAQGYSALLPYSRMFEEENAASKAELERNGQELLIKELENDIAVLLEVEGKENYRREL